MWPIPVFKFREEEMMCKRVWTKDQTITHSRIIINHSLAQGSSESAKHLDRCHCFILFHTYKFYFKFLNNIAET